MFKCAEIAFDDMKREGEGAKAKVAKAAEAAKFHNNVLSNVWVDHK